jgi:hypothetical protein
LGIPRIVGGGHLNRGQERHLSVWATPWRARARRGRLGLPECWAYTSGTHARKDENRLLLEFPCSPIRTHYV